MGVEPSHYEPGDRASGHAATTGAHAAQPTEDREAVRV
jgi:hypothetical protein